MNSFESQPRLFDYKGLDGSRMLVGGIIDFEALLKEGEIYEQLKLFEAANDALPVGDDVIQSE